MVERVTEAGGLGDDIVGAEMTSRRCLQKLMLMNLFVVVVTVEREEAMVNKSLMPSGDDDGEPVLDVAVERDEAAMIVSVEITVGENASHQLVGDSTGDDA